MVKQYNINIIMKLKITFIALLSIFFIGCKEEFNSPIEKDSPLTGNVSNVSVENLPGAAVLTYSVPTDPSFLYVLAEVTSKTGTIRQFKSSHYINTLKLDGFGDTNTYQVQLYAVNKSEVKSEPISVEVNPLTPPFLTVYETVEVTEDFGGVNIKFKNESEADVGIILYATDSLGDFKQYGSFYSKAKSGSHTFRGMRSENTKIGVFVRDRWENTSDTLIDEVTPLHEEMLKKPYVDITLPGDAKIYEGLHYISKAHMWSGRWSTNFADPYNPGQSMTTDMPNALTPLHVTFALNGTQKARLSRIRINHYYTYTNRDMKKYEIWGHPGPYPSDGSWNGWIKLGSYEQKKPSGLPNNQFSEEDKRVWAEGDNFDLLPDAPPIQYIRIRCIENWAGNANMAIAEVTLWGSVID